MTDDYGVDPWEAYREDCVDPGPGEWDRKRQDSDTPDSGNDGESTGSESEGGS
jgi:hypothetical protein